MHISNREKDFLAIFSFLALFLVLVFWKLETLPGWTDELAIADVSLGLRYGANAFTLPLWFWPTINIPGMINFYTGSFLAYISLPFLYLLHPSIIAVRIGFILFAATGLVSIYYCTKYWLGRGAALTAGLLAAVNTNFLQAVRVGAEAEELLVTTLFWSGLALLLHQSRKKRPGTAALLAAFLWGLAIFAKFLMLGHLMGILCLWFLSGKDTRTWIKQKVFFSIKHSAGLLAAMCLGALPVINALMLKDPRYNAHGDISMEILSLLDKIIYGSDGLSLLIRIPTRVTDLLVMAATNFIDAETDYNPAVAGAKLAVLILALVPTIIYMFKNKGTNRTKAGLRLFAAVHACVFLALCCVPYSMVRLHIIAMFPCVELLIVLGMTTYVKISRPGRLKQSALTLAACAYGALNLWQYTGHTSSFNHQYIMKMSGQMETFNDIRNANLHPCMISSNLREYSNVLQAAWMTAPLYDYPEDVMQQQSREIRNLYPVTRAPYYIVFRSELQKPLTGMPKSRRPEMEHIYAHKTPKGDFRHCYRVNIENKEHKTFIVEYFPNMFPLHNRPPALKKKNS